jgi:hypothetical protein
MLTVFAPGEESDAGEMRRVSLDMLPPGLEESVLYQESPIEVSLAAPAAPWSAPGESVLEVASWGVVVNGV